MADVFKVLIVQAEAGRAPREIVVDAVKGTTIRGVIEQCGLAGPDLSGLRVGVWGKVVNATRLVADGDRIEIYRPLTVDPKIARQRRATKKQASA